MKIILCSIGVRSYNVAKILINLGFENVLVYPGGKRFYRSTHYLKAGGEEKKDNPANFQGISEVKSLTIDCVGMQCPGPIMKVNEVMNKMSDSEVIEVITSDIGFLKDIKAWAKQRTTSL